MSMRIVGVSLVVMDAATNRVDAATDIADMAIIGIDAPTSVIDTSIISRGMPSETVDVATMIMDPSTGIGGASTFLVDMHLKADYHCE